MTDVIAWLGAIIGTIALMLTAYKIYIDRPSLHVKATWGRFMGPSGKVGDNQLCVIAINKGRRIKILEAAGLRLSNNWNIPYMGMPYEKWPIELQEGGKKDVFFDVKKIKSTLEDTKE